MRMSTEYEERQLLAMMLLRGDHISKVLKAGVPATHYSSSRHSLIHNAIIDTSIETRGRSDAVTLAEFLDKAGQLETAGGIDYLVEILDTDYPTIELAELTASVVRHRG